MGAEAVFYRTVYEPDPEVLRSLAPSDRPSLSVLGNEALRRIDAVAYEVYEGDLVGHPWENDPRSYGKDGLEGHVDIANLYLNTVSIALLDRYYQQYFDDNFYIKHSLPPGVPMSAIIKHFYQTDEKGAYAVPRENYLTFLEDLQGFHALAVAEFDERAPGYVDDFKSRLLNSELSYLAPIYDSRIAETPIILDDGFSTLINGSLGTVHGQWIDQKIVLAPVRETEHPVFIHESVHRLEGICMDVTFEGRIFLAHALSESLAGQTEAYLLHGGDIQSIDPDVGGRPDVAKYTTYRKTLDMLCNGGRNVISIHDFIATNTNDMAVTDQSLLDALAAAFPDHPQLLDELENQLDEMYIFDNLIDEAAEIRLLKYLEDVKAHYNNDGSLANRLRKISAMASYAVKSVAGRLWDKG